MDSSQPPTKAIVGLVVVVLLVIAATAVVATGKAGKDSAPILGRSSSSSSSANSSPSTAPSATTNFKDGTYTASANYETPGGTQTMNVKLTVSGNTVTDVSITQNATEREDEAYQSAFESEYKSGVVGKKVSDISLSRVAGASLTTDGFNSALADIEKQATA